MSADDNIYQAEKILDTKLVKGKRLFLIKWHGWDESANTWEPERNILDPRLIEEFRKRQRKVRKKKNILKRRSTVSSRPTSSKKRKSFKNAKEISQRSSSVSSSTSKSSSASILELANRIKSKEEQQAKEKKEAEEEEAKKKAVEVQATGGEQLRNVKREAEGLRPIQLKVESSTRESLTQRLKQSGLYVGQKADNNNNNQMRQTTKRIKYSDDEFDNESANNVNVFKLEKKEELEKRAENIEDDNDDEDDDDDLDDEEYASCYDEDSSEEKDTTSGSSTTITSDSNACNMTQPPKLMDNKRLDDVVVTDVTSGVVTVTIKECFTHEGFFKKKRTS